MAQAETDETVAESAECDHVWYPLGVAHGGRSGGYCRRCFELRWLSPDDWQADRERWVERRREAMRAGEGGS